MLGQPGSAMESLRGNDEVSSAGERLLANNEWEKVVIVREAFIKGITYIVATVNWLDKC